MTYRCLAIGSLLLATSACVERGSVLSSELLPEEDAMLSALSTFPVEGISASDVHTCALSAGIAYCWGDNAAGQIGSPSPSDRVGPTAVPGGDWQSIVVGLSHSCALQRGGDVYCWGDNERGQLGQGQREVITGPVRVPLPGAATQLASGFRHSCALLASSELWCWGDGNEGQLGRGDFFSSNESRAEDALLPERIAVPDGATDGWSFVDTGQGHTCALRTDGSLWCWGRNTGRQLGQPSEEGQIRSPVRVGVDTDWQSVDAAQNYSCALKADGSLWCWGFNMGFMSRSGNPFGMSDTLQLDQPTQVAEGQWRALSTNMFHTCAIDPAAQLWCWGRNHEGQLAMENPPDPENPGSTLNVQPRTLVASGAALVAAGTFTTCVAPAGGGLRCVGKNDRGQLGVATGPSTDRFVDVPLPGAP